jgi:putative flippase GtrA
MRLTGRSRTWLRSWRLLRFGVVGGSGALVNLGALYVGQEFLFRNISASATRLNWSLAVAILLATINNFCWNSMWTWRDRHTPGSAIVIQFGQYALACWVGIVLQIVFTKLLAMRFNYAIANLSAIAGAGIFNYLVNDLWTFQRGQAAVSVGVQPADPPCSS